MNSFEVVFKNFFMYKEPELFIHWVKISDNLFKENHSVWLDEDCILCVPTETLMAHIEVIFPDQIVLVWADTEWVRTLAEFSQVASAILPVTQLAFSGASMEKTHEFL